MLKHFVNEARLSIDITTTGPLLVKSGHATLSGPDMTPILTHRNGQLQAFLPGSSLKGVVRSHLERVTRTLKPGITCDPFARVGGPSAARDRTSISCSDAFARRAGNRVDSETAYAESCPICRIFGSLSFTGRLSLSDAYTPDGTKPVTERRDGVGIDRLTSGAAHGAKFDLEVVSAGTVFRSEVLLRNFECWQLGALLLLVGDLKDGLLRIGSGRSRGLGGVRGALAGTPPALEIHTIDVHTDQTPTDLWGLGRVVGDRSYGTEPEDMLTLSTAPTHRRQGVRSVRTFGGSALDDLQERAIAAFIDRIERWNGRPALQTLA